MMVGPWWLMEMAAEKTGKAAEDDDMIEASEGKVGEDYYKEEILKQMRNEKQEHPTVSFETATKKKKKQKAAQEFQ